MVNKSVQAYSLDNKEWLLKQLQEKSMTELARELGLFRGSIQWAARVFNDDQKATFKMERRKRR